MVLNALRRRDVKRAMWMRVKLDGKLAPRCYYADGRRGVIREFVEDAKGRLVVNKWFDFKTGEFNAEIVKRERRGKVTWVPIRPAGVTMHG